MFGNRFGGRPRNQTEQPGRNILNDEWRFGNRFGFRASLRRKNTRHNQTQYGDCQDHQRCVLLAVHTYLDAAPSGLVRARS